MLCIFQHCEQEVQGILAVNDERNEGMTVVMAPACQEHAATAQESGLVLRLLPGSVLAEHGSDGDADIMLRFERFAC